MVRRALAVLLVFVAVALVARRAPVATAVSARCSAPPVSGAGTPVVPGKLNASTRSERTARYANA